MTLLKTTSDRVDEKGRSYTDFYLAWRHQDKFYSVRIKPSFVNNSKLLFGEAVNVPQGEALEKYLD